MFLKRRWTTRTRKPAHGSTKEKAPKLDDAIRVQDWASVRTALETSKDARRGATKKAINLTTRKGGNSSLLSLAVSLDAPADVVSALVREDPSAGNLPDSFGRLPIHVACSYGASAEVVSLLLDADPSSALWKDCDGRLPLHYAAEYGAGSFGETLGSVAVLCAAEPVAAFARDSWGETPQEVVAEMKATAELDNDLEMVTAARAVCRVLRQATSAGRVRESERKDAGPADATEEKGSESFCTIDFTSERQDVTLRIGKIAHPVQKRHLFRWTCKVRGC